MNPNRLLVIDDEPDICEFIKDAAEGTGFEVTATSDPDDFRSGYRDFSPTVIILDLHIPDTDGVELLRYLAEDQCGAGILLISGVDSRVLRTARRLGASRGLNMLGSLQKPIMLHELDATLRQALKREYSVTERDLKDAIDNGHLCLHYQPKVSLQSDSKWIIGGAEALVRWQHPQHDLLMPDEFISLAEESGLISALTDFVLGEAIRQMRLWRDDGMPMSVAVNLAPQLLHQMDLPDRVGEMLKTQDMKGDNLILEITESAAMTDTTRTMDILTRFRIKDIGLSIDDFGTGYSSFVQLYRMPFSELKIDKSFVLDMHQDEEAKIIVRSIANLGHNLGLSLCAEGVETREALDLLRSFGCEKIQGYLVSRPLEADALSDFVADWDPQSG